MKVKRNKTNKRHVAFFKNKFKFREPFQILVDGNFCQVALDYKIDIADKLPKVLTIKTKELTTRCVMQELYALGERFQPAYWVARQFELRRCPHKEPVPAAQCLKSIIGESNEHRYCVATQDKILRDHLRGIPGVPLLYINYNTIILEPPSGTSVDDSQLIETMKSTPSAMERKIAAKISGVVEVTPEPKPKKRKRGISEPNPLSVKKKKQKTTPSSQPKKSEESLQSGEAGTTGEKADPAPPSPPKKKSRRGKRGGKTARARSSASAEPDDTVHDGEGEDDE